jgi:hypothetical protein
MISKKIEALNKILEKEGYRTKHIEEIEAEINSSMIWKDKITLTHNDEFEIIFNADTEKVELKTTFSNQLITKDWLSKITYLVNMIEIIENM